MACSFLRISKNPCFWKFFHFYPIFGNTFNSISEETTGTQVRRRKSCLKKTSQLTCQYISILSFLKSSLNRCALPHHLRDADLPLDCDYLYPLDSKLVSLNNCNKHTYGTFRHAIRYKLI